MNVKEFLESKPKVGTKVTVEVPVEVCHSSYGIYLHSTWADILPNQAATNKYEVIIPKPELPTKLGAVINHGEFGLHVLADFDNAPWHSVVENEWRSCEALTATGTFTVLSEGVDE